MFVAHCMIDQQLPTPLLFSLVQVVLPSTSGIQVPGLAASCPLELPSQTVHDPDLCKPPSSHFSPLVVETLHPVSHQSFRRRSPKCTAHVFMYGPRALEWFCAPSARPVFGEGVYFVSTGQSLHIVSTATVLSTTSSDVLSRKRSRLLRSWRRSRTIRAPFDALLGFAHRAHYERLADEPSSVGSLGQTSCTTLLGLCADNHTEISTACPASCEGPRLVECLVSKDSGQAGVRMLREDGEQDPFSSLAEGRQWCHRRPLVGG